MKLRCAEKNSPNFELRMSRHTASQAGPFAAFIIHSSIDNRPGSVGDCGGEGTPYEIKEALAVALLLLPPRIIMAEDLVRIGLFNKDAAIIAAQEKGSTA